MKTVTKEIDLYLTDHSYWADCRALWTLESGEEKTGIMTAGAKSSTGIDETQLKAYENWSRYRKGEPTEKPEKYVRQEGIPEVMNDLKGLLFRVMNDPNVQRINVYGASVTDKERKLIDVFYIDDMEEILQTF